MYVLVFVLCRKCLPIVLNLHHGDDLCDDYRSFLCAELLCENSYASSIHSNIAYIAYSSAYIALIIGVC